MRPLVLLIIAYELAAATAQGRRRGTGPSSGLTTRRRTTPATPRRRPQSAPNALLAAEPRPSLFSAQAPPAAEAAGRPVEHATAALATIEALQDAVADLTRQVESLSTAATKAHQMISEHGR